MKSQFKYTPMVLALAAMFLSPAVLADGKGNHDAVSIKKKVSLEQDVEIDGRVRVGGYIDINASSVAVVDDKQVTGANIVDNNEVTNAATVGGNALNNAAGNIGVNVTAGDNNQQANAAALAAADASFVFASSDAEVFATQAAFGNNTTNLGNTNTATLGGSALANASGNIGVNISAGNSNQQKNDMAASVAAARMATATVQANQMNGGNHTTNNPIAQEEVQYVDVNLALNAAGGYLGYGTGGYLGYASGTTEGTSDQIGNVYPDIWTGGASSNDVGQHSPHPGGDPSGHFDLDTQTQGGSDLNGDGGALAFNNSGSYSGTEGGVLGFVEAGAQVLSGTVTGSLPVVVSVNLATTNTSTLAGNALQNASGNIGVNIASGTNNQQFNGLAISATHAPTAGGNGGGSEF